MCLKKKMKIVCDTVDRSVLLKTIFNAVIEANRNGRSEPFYCSNAEYVKIAIRFFLHREGYCISKPFYRDLPLDECRYYFDPEDLIEICELGEQEFVLISKYKALVQDLKKNLDTMLRKVELDYNNLHPIDGWNSEYDEFMD